MSLSGIDDILDEDNFLSNKTWEEILEAVVRAYSIVIIKREKEGNFYTGFSRKEYMKYKREEDPHYRTIENFLGSWSVIKNILPVGSQKSRQKFSDNDYDKETVIRYLNEASKYFNLQSFTELTIKQFDEYRMISSDNIRSWRFYSRLFGYGDKWKSFLTAMGEYSFRKDVTER